MPDKNKPSQKLRPHRESKGSARGARKTQLTELEKILIGNGGMAHARLRKNARAGGYTKKSAQRSQKNEAKA